MRNLLPLLLFSAPLFAADPPKAKPPGKGTSYAFLVGCAGYNPKVLEPIRADATVNDVIEFKKALLATGFKDENITLMHDKQAEKGGAGLGFVPERAKIAKKLDLFLGGLTDKDTVVVAVSGHGVHFKGDSTGYFCPLDADLSDKSTLLPFDGDGGLFTQLEKCKAGRKLLIANACRDAPVVRGADLAGAKIELDDKDDEVVPKGIAALYSCEPGQKSFYDPKRGRSYFFLHLTDAWTAGGSLEGVFDTARTKTRDEVKKAEEKKQFPVVKRRYEGEWVITVAKENGYDLTGGKRSAHFGKDGVIRVVVTRNDFDAKRYEAWVVDPLGGKVLTGPLKHADTVGCAAFSPDGTKVVTTSSDKTAALWNAKTGDKIATLKHADFLNHAAFSPDGAKVTTSAGKTVAVWDATTGKKLIGPLTHAETVQCLAFNSDGRKVVTASLDGTAAVWDAMTGDKLFTLTDGFVAHAMFCPDGATVMTISFDKKAAVWDAMTGEKRHSVKHDNYGASHAALSPDRAMVVTAGYETAVVWDAKTGATLAGPLNHTIDNTPFNDVLHVAFSPDGKRVVTASSDQTAVVWDTMTGKKLAILKHASAVSFATFSQNGANVITINHESAIIWDAKTGEKLGSVTAK